MKLLMIIIAMSFAVSFGNAQSIPSPSSPDAQSAANVVSHSKTHRVKKVAQKNIRKLPPKRLLRSDSLSPERHTASLNRRKHISRKSGLHEKEFDPATEPSIDERVVDEQLNEQRESEEEREKIHSEEEASMERAARDAKGRDSQQSPPPKHAKRKP